MNPRTSYLSTFRNARTKVKERVDPLRQAAALRTPEATTPTTPIAPAPAAEPETLLPKPALRRFPPRY